MGDAERKRRKRADERDLSIPRIADPNRRRDCEADVYEFLSRYFAGVFYQPFTADRREMVDAIEHAAQYGGDQAIAGPRADGKTRSALFVGFFLLIKRKIRFPMIISKSGDRASRELRNLKEAVRDSREFAADYPEICVPILDVGRWSSRARQQTAYMHPTNMEWGNECIVLPTIPSALLWQNGWNEDFESAAAGQLMSSVGIEGSFRGYSVKNERPDLAIIDDVDDRESARSEVQTENREKIIEEDIGGLAGPDKTVARVMLCTLINRTCIAATFTDRQKKPSWRGQRHKLLLKRPENESLWDEYIALREGRGDDDPDARRAHAFYVEHRTEMDLGAIVTNPFRFDSRILSNGEPAELSALQACYNLIADRNWDHFNTEYQNDPPEEEGMVESGLTAYRIQKQVNGYERDEIPADCTKLTMGVDCGKHTLNWVLRAWAPNGTGYTIDYGFYNVEVGSDESQTGIDLGIKRAVEAFIEEYRDAYARPIDRFLVDARYRTDAVVQACSRFAPSVMPIMGFGKSRGCMGAHLSIPPRRTADTMPGDNWVLKRLAKRSWVVQARVDHWKAWEHDRWMTARGMPGCMTLFGRPSEIAGRLSEDEFEHKKYAVQIVSEREVEEYVRGVMVRHFRTFDKRNHFLDASVYCNVAASLEGIRLGSAAQQASRSRVLPPGQRMSLEQMRDASSGKNPAA